MSQEPVIGVQLYTVRDSARADIATTLRRVAEIGYPAVEPYDLLSAPEALAEAVARHQLRVPAAHAGLLGENRDALLAAAGRLGISTLVVPYAAPERFADAAGVDALAAELNAAAERAADDGIRVGYHNHHFELTQRVEGRAALERLADGLDPRVVLELDIYWAAFGEPDVPALLDRLGDRVRFLHLKDGPLELGRPHVALGDGRVPVTEILAAARHAEAAFVELDECDGDVFAALDGSLRYLTAGTATAGVSR